MAIATPKCSVCKKKMTKRDMKNASYEQKWCGTWYDCNRHDHTQVTALIPSPKLKIHLAEQRAATK